MSDGLILLGVLAVAVRRRPVQGPQAARDGRHRAGASRWRSAGFAIVVLILWVAQRH